MIDTPSNRLITFGCSHTFGVGLIDIYPEKTKPSKYAWPNVLGNLLNYTVCNESKPGAGNAEIFDNILRYQFRPNDLVIIMWSHFVRFDHLIIENGYLPKRQWKEIGTKTIIDSEYHNAYKNYLTFQHCELLLSSQQIESYSFLSWYSDEILYPKPNFISIKNLIDIKINDMIVDKALDDLHYGTESHKNIAHSIYDRIKLNVLH